jgi:hypothetical protein
MIPVSDVVTHNTYIGIQSLREMLFNEVVYHLYDHGKGKPGSPAKALRSYGFHEKRKDKLLKEVTVYLNTVEVIPMEGG